MLCWILIIGGPLIMMGQHDRSESLFYYFRLEDQVPETHLLRLIEKHISFAFVREPLKGSYSETGRPSIDPELLLRILLIGYLYGITSERKLVEELRMHLDWRWFTGLAGIAGSDRTWEDYGRLDSVTIMGVWSEGFSWALGPLSSPFSIAVRGLVTMQDVATSASLCYTNLQTRPLEALFKS
jgi:hypothetical protein